MDPDLLDRITSWARELDNIRAVVLTGSTARGMGETDELSDLDIELYARRPSELLDDDSWYSRFGTLLAVEALPNPGWHPTRLLYLAGAKIDFLIAPVSALERAAYEHPFRVLVDKDGLAAKLVTRTPSSHLPPEEDAFLECVNWFFAAAIMCAKCIARDEPWMAKFRDWDLKCQLLRMIEWDHKARHGWSYETWFNGKHLGQWMDPEVRLELEACWAGFPVEQSRQALMASLDLFERLTQRVSAAIGAAPVHCQPVRTEVTAMLADRPAGPI